MYKFTEQSKKKTSMESRKQAKCVLKTPGFHSVRFALGLKHYGLQHPTDLLIEASLKV